MARSRSVAPRIITLFAAAFAVRWFSCSAPAYAVKGSWEGSPNVLKDLVKGDLDSVVKGLEPNINFPSVSYDKSGLTLTLEGDRLNADYTSTFDDKTFNLRIDDAQAWRAGVNTGSTSLLLRGQGLSTDGLFWEASQSSSADGVGDVQVQFNSNNVYNLTVARENLDQIFGIDVDSVVRATNNGVTGRVAARRAVGPADVSYTFENTLGVYDVTKAAHDAQVEVQAAGGKAALRLASDAGQQGVYGSYVRDVQGGEADVRVSREGNVVGYKASYARPLNDLTSAVDADVNVGVDQAGAFAKVAARRDIGNDFAAEYEASGRIEQAGGQSFEHSVKLSNQLGYAQLVQSKGDAARLRVGYEFNP